MRVTSKGQVTIPQDIRRKAGIQPGTEVAFKREKGRIYLVKQKGAGDGRSRFARVRGCATLKMSTDEIMALTRGEMMPDFLVDSNVLLDLFFDDPHWADWSEATLERCARRGSLFINPVIYSEVSIGFERIEDLESALRQTGIEMADIPREALFLAGKAFLNYRRRSGKKRFPLPDFYIGAHAAVSGMHLLTRDTGRYQTAYPRLKIISP